MLFAAAAYLVRFGLPGPGALRHIVHLPLLVNPRRA